MKILNSKEISQITGLSRVTVWRMERKGQFPKRITLSPRRVGWIEDQINKWIFERKEVNAD
jgi:prophage regulatory protein